MTLRETIDNLREGSFTASEPAFFSGDIKTWFDEGKLDDETAAEALTCACWLGLTPLAEHFMDRGVPMGDGTGFDGFHWAANRGQLDVVRCLIRRGVSMDTVSRFGGKLLGTAVWSALNETKPEHPTIVKEILEAGAKIDDACLDQLGFPTKNLALNEVLEPYVNQNRTA